MGSASFTRLAIGPEVLVAEFPLGGQNLLQPALLGHFASAHRDRKCTEGNSLVTTATVLSGFLAEAAMNAAGW